MTTRLALIGVGIAVGALLGTGASAAEESGEYGPLDRPGHALSVPNDKLAASLACHGDVAGSPATPVLMLNGGGVTSRTSEWNYQKQFRELDIPFCVLNIPNFGSDDLQIAGEHAVHGIRTMHAIRGGKINVFSQSEGAIPARWALRFWPDTRLMVDDVVALAPPQHGTGPTIYLWCVSSSLTSLNPPTNCQPGGFQITPGSEFLQALNEQETFPGISYTNVATRLDEAVRESPFLASDGGDVSNVTIQDTCPLDVNEHLLTIGIDPVSYALTLDAMRNPGPADPARIDQRVCTQVLAPSIDPIALPGHLVEAGLETVQSHVFGRPSATSEPLLRCYALTEGC